MQLQLQDAQTQASCHRCLVSWVEHLLSHVQPITVFQVESSPFGELERRVRWPRLEILAGGFFP